MFEILNFDNISEEYQDLIFKENKQTIFSTKLFLSYHLDKFNTEFLIYKKNNKELLLLPFVRDNDSLSSHPGASYGGFVELKNIKDSEFEKIFNELNVFIKNNNINEVNIRYSPDIFLSKNNFDFNDYIKSKSVLNYEQEETYIELSGRDFENLNKTGFRKGHVSDISKFKNTINFSIKKLEKENEVSSYYSLLENNTSKYGVKPTHSKDDLYKLINLLPNHIEIFGLFSDSGLLISGITIFVLNQKTVAAFYSNFNHDLGNQARGGLKYLYWELLKKYKHEGYKFFTFGVDVKPGEPENKNLRYFKDGFGSNQDIRSNYTLTIS